MRSRSIKQKKSSSKFLRRFEQIAQQDLEKLNFKETRMKSSSNQFMKN